MEIYSALPKDYNTWSSTVIIFQGKDDGIGVYAFNCDGIRTRQWTTDGFPKLKPPKLKPFCGGHRLYVLASAVSCRPEETHFEMVQGWGFVPELSFVRTVELARYHANNRDYSKMLLYTGLLEFSYSDCTSDLYAFSLQDEGRHKLTTLTACMGNPLKASRLFDCVVAENYLYCFQTFRYPDGLRAIHDIEPFNLSVSYSMANDTKIAVAGGREKGMETDKRPAMETDRETVEVLPDDYNNWSSTVIFFKSLFGDRELSVYAFDCDECVVYYVLSYQGHWGDHRSLGYTVGDFKVYFVGKVIFDEVENCPVDSLVVEVYDIRNRRWITDDFPELNAPKPSPFVFFLDGKLYVLSSSGQCLQGETHFEMLDVNNLEKDWVFLPDPSFVGKDTWPLHQNKIIDYSEKTFYIEFDDCECTLALCGYSLHDNGWHEFKRYGTFTGRAGNLKKGYWTDSSIIVENYFYTFQMLEYPDGLRATIFIHDLEHDTGYDYHYPSVEGIWNVDISSVVNSDVLRAFGAFGFLFYLGKRNSCQRFSLIISYNCDVYACTIDLRRSGENSAEPFILDAGQCQKIKMDDYMSLCHKLCEVKCD